MSDKRENHRLDADSATYIELESPAVGTTDTGVVVACKTLNVSREGLLVALDQQLPEAAVLQIAVALPGADESMYLAAEVRWCRPGNDVQDVVMPWRAGLRVLKSRETDAARWEELVVALELESVMRTERNGD